ncbi:MAG: hypothetical protein HOP11_00510 [Saprospiraceae bacterium]|nr:hypothetical protein [Saprospiraceae bacterium]
MRISRITNAKLSELFRKFKKIQESQHYDYIAFCNYHFQEIQKLEFEEYIEIKYAYVKALYHLDRASLFYKIADQSLLEVINQEEFTEQYKNIYYHILLLKAERLLEEKKFNQSRKIYQNLYRLNPEDKKAKNKLWFISFRLMQSQQKNWLTAAAILLILSLFTLIAASFLILPFFSKYSDTALNVVNLMLLLSLSMVSLSFIKTYISTKTMMRNLDKELQ